MHRLATLIADNWLSYLEDCVELVDVIDGCEIYVATDRRLQKYLRDSDTDACQLGDRVLVRAKYLITQSLLAHELCHVSQSRNDMLFLLWYYIENLLYGYTCNFYEVQARKAESRGRRRSAA